jgi:NAD-dependent dihydropyrimidine dehydrogenase PreA subunit
MIKILEIKDRCTACMTCYNICKVKAIAMLEDDEGFWHPQIDESTCTNCLLCEKICPEINEDDNKITNLIQKAYYGWHNDDNIRERSSSGGAFTAFADYILKNNGVVYGAVYDNEKQMVLHKSTDECSLDAMRKSKYVQSYIGDSFNKVKANLQQGKKIFYVGTPCQIAGLKMFCDDENLITCDFICHGVPPMSLLLEDFKLLENKYHDKIINFDFRPKVKSWSFDFFQFLLNLGKEKIFHGVIIVTIKDSLII